MSSRAPFVDVTDVVGFRGGPRGKNRRVSGTTTGRRGRRRSRLALALAYHAIADDWDNPLSVTSTRFAAHVRHLRELGYTGVRFSDLAHDPDARDVVAITFDDAFSSVCSRALPLLDELGWPATVFASSAVVDAGEPMTWLLGVQGQAPERDDTLRPLRWDDLRLLHDRGWEIGSHGATHRRLSALATDERDRELTAARARIEAEVGPCTAISYPWGEVVDEVVEAAVATGHTAGSGLEGRFEERDPMRVPRFAVSRYDGALRFAAKTSRTLSTVRRTPVWSGLERIRRRDYEPLGDASERRDALPL
jgi:peptidoglycan/xylan/chitin deacetylase (PgdA/CDA1 family)